MANEIIKVVNLLEYTKYSLDKFIDVELRVYNYSEGNSRTDLSIDVRMTGNDYGRYIESFDLTWHDKFPSMTEAKDYANHRIQQIMKNIIYPAYGEFPYSWDEWYELTRSSHIPF